MTGEKLDRSTLLPWSQPRVDQIIAAHPVVDAEDVVVVRIRYVQPRKGWVTERVGHVPLREAWAVSAQVAALVGGTVVDRDRMPVVVLPERLLTVSEVISLLDDAGQPIKTKTWESYVARGQAPRPVQKRPNRWSEAMVEAWLGNRPGVGARTDLDPVRMVATCLIEGWIDSRTWQATDVTTAWDAEDDRRWRLDEALAAAADPVARDKVRELLGGHFQW